MLSRFVGAAVVLFAVGGFILAGEHTGWITKHDSKDGITMMTRGKVKGEKGEEKTFKVAKGVKIMKGEDAVEAKDFDEMVTKAAEGKGKMKGVMAKVTTDSDDKVTKIEILQRKGKGKKKDNN